MFSTQVIQSVGENVGRIRTPLWKTGRTSEIESAGLHISDGNMRQTNRFSDPIVNAKIQWVQLRIRAENNMNAVKSEPRLIHQIRSKRVRLIQRENLTMRTTCVAKARDVVALQTGLA